MTELYDLYEKLGEIESLMYSLQPNDDIDWDKVRISAAISAMNGLLASERCEYWDDNLYIKQSVSYADTQIYELSHIGYKQQRDLAVDVFSKCDIPMYLISGNHDSWYSHMGADIVEEICSERPNMTYLGYNQADIDIDGATLRLFHGTDGGSRTLSYRLQLLSESYTIGKKPNILLAGHTHKMCYIFDRMIHCVSVPSLQMQTSWMASKKLAAHTGFLVIEFDTNHNGVCNFQFRYYPFYA